jgi:hypothetical protein
MPVSASDPILRAAIWERWEAERPRAGHDYAAWVERVAEEAAVPQHVVRNVVSRGAGALLNEINRRTLTHAQEIAELLGADLVSALETFRRGLTATRKRPLLDKAGRPKLLDPNGPLTAENVTFIEVEDWDARLSAAHSLVEVYGARAPQQIEVNSKTVVMDLTTEEALAEIAQVAERAAQLRAAYSNATTDRVARIGGDRSEAAGAAGEP